jgi:hypothetical protein
MPWLSADVADMGSDSIGRLIRSAHRPARIGEPQDAFARTLRAVRVARSFGRDAGGRSAGPVLYYDELELEEQLSYRQPIRPAATSPSTLTASGRQLWLPRVLGLLALLGAAAPMLVAGAIVAMNRPAIIFDGDAAADELALIRSTHLEQLVGNYSRFQWNHPGPAWFYALDTFYVPLGVHSWSFQTAVLLLHAVFAALIVAVAWRSGGPPLAIVTSALLLLYVRAVGELQFQTVWPPYATMLPMALFFLLAAAGAAGSRAAMVGALIAGSFLAQLHVGTVPLVGGIIACMVAIRLVTWLVGWLLARRSPAREAAAGRQSWFLTLAGLAVVALMWLPPAVDQATGNPGNLTKLYNFFLNSHAPRHPYHEALSALGRMLQVYPFGSQPDVLQDFVGPLPADRALTIAGFVLAAVVLLIASTWLRDRFAQALAILLLFATPVVVISISRIIGPVYAYLLSWLATFPMLLAIGWSALIVRARPWERLRGPAPAIVSRALAGALVVAIVALGVGRLSGLQQASAAADTPVDASTTSAWQLTERALADQPPGAVRLKILNVDRWPQAAGLALQLDKDGRHATVDDGWVFLFGEGSRGTGSERYELVIGDPGTTAASQPGAQPIGQTADTALLLRRLPPGDRA